MCVRCTTVSLIIRIRRCLRSQDANKAKKKEIEPGGKHKVDARPMMPFTGLGIRLTSFVLIQEKQAPLIFKAYFWSHGREDISTCICRGFSPELLVTISHKANSVS